MNPFRCPTAAGSFTCAARSTQVPCFNFSSSVRWTRRSVRYPRQTCIWTKYGAEPGSNSGPLLCYTLATECQGQNHIPSLAFDTFAPNSVHRLLAPFLQTPSFGFRYTSSKLQASPSDTLPPNSKHCLPVPFLQTPFIAFQHPSSKLQESPSGTLPRNCRDLLSH